MHFNLHNVLIVATLISAVYLFFNKGDRVFPIIATIAAAIEALLAFGVMSLSVAKFRIDVILPALLLVAGAVTWGRSSTKGSITAATIVTLVGAIQLTLALRILT